MPAYTAYITTACKWKHSVLPLISATDTFDKEIPCKHWKFLIEMSSDEGWNIYEGKVLLHVSCLDLRLPACLGLFKGPTGTASGIIATCKVTPGRLNRTTCVFWKGPWLKGWNSLKIPQNQVPVQYIYIYIYICMCVYRNVKIWLHLHIYICIHKYNRSKLQTHSTSQSTCWTLLGKTVDLLAPSWTAKI